jgi:type IV pilus assembly protein PilB
LNSGYKGRIAIFEVMPMSEAIAKLTMERADTNVVAKQAIKEGMTPLVEDGVRRIIEGVTTIEEVLSVAAMDHRVDA